jgi:hypothetical protein
MRDPTAHECPECGETVSRFARACPECDAPNPGWKTLVAAGTIAGLLVVAAIVAGSIWLWRWSQEVDVQAGGDFGWLTDAMAMCDDEAAQTPSTLFFIVIPLTAETADIAAWRAKSLNDIGNGVLLKSADALDGLKDGMLKLSNKQYVFGVRDQMQVVYKWKAAAGVARFSTADADGITRFNIQLLSGDKASESEWGAAFSRQQGSCYWVNAIIGL